MTLSNIIKVIELNPTELCNLKCSFCPRATFYPNQNLHISLDTVKKFRERLEEFKYTKVVSFTGRGEPTLVKNFEDIANILLKERKYKLKINTNGKNLDKYLSYISRFDIVNYDVYSESWNDFEKIVDKYIKYDNFNFYFKPTINLKEDYSDRYTNRAGSFEQDSIEDGFCDMIYEKLYIHWNGDYKLCCQDWKHDITLGNIFQENFTEYIYKNKKLNSFRNMLTSGDRSSGPCKDCDYRSTCSKNTAEKYKKLNENLSVI